MLCKNCALCAGRRSGTNRDRTMANPARPWTRFYHPLTAHDVVAPRWPHLPAAAVREAAATYADRTAFTLALPNGSQGGLTLCRRRSTVGSVRRLSPRGRRIQGRAIASRCRCRTAWRIRSRSSARLKAGLVMVNTNPLYTVPEMVHQFADSGAVGLVAIDLFAPKVQRSAAEDLDQDRGRSSASPDLLPTLRRLLVRAVQKYVKKMVPPITFAHTTFASALSQGRRANHVRRRSARLRRHR